MENVSSVRNHVNNILDCASVLDEQKKSASTGVDCTEETSKIMNDSNFDLNTAVETHVQHSNQNNEIQSDFEFDSDANSEISIII